MAEQIFDKFKYGNDTFIVQDNVSGYITTETDPVFTASPAHGITANDITNWNAAEPNVNADWNATSGDAQILNKPTNLSSFVNDVGYIDGVNGVTKASLNFDLTENASKEIYTLLVNGSTAALYYNSTPSDFAGFAYAMASGRSQLYAQILNESVSFQTAEVRAFYISYVDMATAIVHLSSVQNGNAYLVELQDVGNGLIGTFSSQTIGGITTETDPVFTASAAYGITSTNITNWNAAEPNVNADWNASSGDAQILNKPTIPTITLNGTSTTTPSFYAPTTTGTNGYVLKSNGSGAPTWTSATLTDTQVTNTAVTATSTYYLTGGSSSATATGTLNKHASISAYVDADTSTTGLSRINLGNGTATGTAGAKQGVLRLYGNTAYYCDIRAESSTPTANRTIYLPSYGGTMYLPCMSTSSAVGSANNPVYVEATGRIVAGNSFVPTTGGTFSGAVTAAASDGTTAQIANIKYGSAAPSGTATDGTVYFQTGSSAYTFQPRVNLPSLSASTTLSEWTHFTLPVGLYLITFQVNCGNINTYNLRVDLIAGSNTITQIRSGNGSNGNGLILNGVGLVECTSSTTIYFKAQTSSSSISNCELHYSYVKLF